MSDKKEKTIFDLELHEGLLFDVKIVNPKSPDFITMQYQVIRVPGGWIYKHEYTGKQTFVPLTSEGKKYDK